MKKHLYRRLFRKAVGVNPARGDQRRISPRQLYSELISEIVDGFLHEQLIGWTKDYGRNAKETVLLRLGQLLDSVVSQSAGGGHA